jgi:hypothetical protein
MPSSHLAKTFQLFFVCISDVPETAVRDITENSILKTALHLGVAFLRRLLFAAARSNAGQCKTGQPFGGNEHALGPIRAFMAPAMC